MHDDPQDAEADPLVGSMIGEYKIKGVIGEGGMGQVYEGLQPVIGKRVAIKLLRRELATDKVEAARLLGEARSVNAIGHRGIIDIFSFGALPDGRQYFVMEYLSGVSLADHLHQHGALPVEDTLKLLDEIAAALGAAHGAGVIHRDLKPSNIFLVAQADGSSFVKVLDFGIAKVAPYARGETPQTRVSRVMGTPEFMAPEQARGQPVGPRTDLYALGVVAFQMLTGELLFDADNPFELVTMHVGTAPRAPSSVRPEIPPEVDTLILSLLEKEAADRPPSAEVLREQLKKLRKTLNLNSTRLALTPASMTQALQAAPPAPSAGKAVRAAAPSAPRGPQTRQAPVSVMNLNVKANAGSTRILDPRSARSGGSEAATFKLDAAKINAAAPSSPPEKLARAGSEPPATLILDPERIAKSGAAPPSTLILDPARIAPPPAIDQAAMEEVAPDEKRAMWVVGFVLLAFMGSIAGGLYLLFRKPPVPAPPQAVEEPAAPAASAKDAHEVAPVAEDQPASDPGPGRSDSE